jgi:hypothetical protein
MNIGLEYWNSKELDSVAIALLKKYQDDKSS